MEDDEDNYTAETGRARSCERVSVRSEKLMRLQCCVLDVASIFTSSSNTPFSNGDSGEKPYNSAQTRSERRRSRVSESTSGEWRAGNRRAEVRVWLKVRLTSSQSALAAMLQPC